MSKVMSITRTTKPDARNILASGSPPSRVGLTAPRAATPRAFTAGEKSLIRKIHGHLPAEDLLRILNERLVCDLGSGAVAYTMEQLYTEIGDATGPAQAVGHDWASLRKLLAKAGRDGVLDSITAQVIDDFAVVYSLNMKQMLVLKDIVLRATEEDAS